jgi:hypothetical protein
LPELHQLGNRDVAPDEIEHTVWPVIGMEADAASLLGHVQRQLGAVIVDLGGGSYGWIRCVALTQPAKRVAHERLAGRELRRILQVLELAAAALIDNVVGTPGIDS